jgi:hypothetical protein
VVLRPTKLEIVLFLFTPLHCEPKPKPDLGVFSQRENHPNPAFLSRMNYFERKEEG